MPHFNTSVIVCLLHDPLPSHSWLREHSIFCRLVERHEPTIVPEVPETCSRARLVVFWLPTTGVLHVCLATALTWKYSKTNWVKDDRKHYFQFMFKHTYFVRGYFRLGHVCHRSWRLRRSSASASSSPQRCSKVDRP